MLFSAERTGLSEFCDWRIYDLGLTPQQAQRLAQRFKWCAFTAFDFSSHPVHVGLEHGSYAWKPIILAENLSTTTAPVFWFDSATIFLTNLERPLRTIRDNGLWVLKSQSPLHLKCDPRVLDALAVPLELRHLTERAAGAIGVDPQHPAAVKLVMDWQHLALQPDFIVPKGAASFHKQDQAILNCLLLKAAASHQLTLIDEEIDISSAKPTTEVSTRNRVHARAPLWLDPVLRSWSAAYKRADRLHHQWQHFRNTRLDGAKRWWKEHFRVHLHEIKTGVTHTIPSPADGYYATPFIWQREGTNWLFMEEFQYARNRGRLVVLELGQTLEPVSVQPLQSDQLEGSFNTHASFPFLFELGGVPHMIPQTCGRKSVDLYVCRNWPDQWHLKRRLLFDVDAVDTMVVASGGLWWIFTSVMTSGRNRHLEIYFTDNLATGDIHPHPQNSSDLYADAAHGSGRNAGYLAKTTDGTLMRLMQESTQFFGQRVACRRIVELSTQAFREEPIESIPDLPLVVPGFRSHHVSRAGDLLAYDVRDRAR